MFKNPKKPIATLPKNEYIVGTNSPSEMLNPKSRAKQPKAAAKPGAAKKPFVSLFNLK